MLQYVRFVIKAGQMVAFVGPSGSGKTTILDLILGLHYRNFGSITIDGHDVRLIDRTSLYDVVGVVHQKPCIFPESIMYNLQYPNNNATTDRVSIVCHTAAIYDKIQSLSEG